MPPIRTVRTILYGLIIAFSLPQTGLAIFASIYAWPDLVLSVDEETTEVAETRGYLPYFSVLGAIVSLLTWVWTSVLLSFNDKPTSNHALSFALPHFVSFGVMAALWLALALMHLTNTRHTCATTNGSGPEGIYRAWCGLDASLGSVALVLFLLATGAAFWVHRTAQKSGTLRSKLLEHDGEHAIKKHMPSYKGEPRKGATMARATKVRTVMYSLLVGLGVCETGLGIFTAISGVGGPWTPVWLIFSCLTALLSLLTWISASVLLSFNRRPYVTRRLTKASTHFYVFVALHVGWLAITIMLFTQTKANCPKIEDPDRGMSACPVFIPFSIVAVILWLLSGATAAYIYSHAKNRSGLGLAGNVAGDEVEDVDGGDSGPLKA